MKILHMELWLIWLYGCLLIGLSIYSTKMLPSIRDHHNGFSDMGAPKVVIFSGPAPFNGSIGDRQILAVRSWLGLSPEVTVVLFSQHPSVGYFARNFSSRISVEPDIDFTFLGTPFFHSMIARSKASVSDIYAMIDPETILLPDFISTLNYAQKIDRAWLLFASIRGISHFPFQLDDTGMHWLGENGKVVQTQKEILAHNGKLNCSEMKMVMAWNNGALPLHNGVLPPFLYKRGVHDQWVIYEAMRSNFRFVFDASYTISSFYVNQVVDERSFESMGNLHLGAVYGSMFFHEDNYSNMIRLLKCNGKYSFVDKAENIILNDEKTTACIDPETSQEKILDCSSKDQLKPSMAIELPFTLETLLPMIADHNKTIVLTIAGNSYKDMLMSWVCRMRRLQITNFMVCALDHDIYQFSVLQGLPVFRDALAPRNISFDDCHFGTTCFRRVTKVKSRLVLRILKMGYNVLLSDVDVYWFKNPVPYLYSFGPAIMAAQSDEYNKTGPINIPRRLNSGFYFARSDDQTIAAMEKIVNHAATSNLSEQPSFYDTLCGEGGSYRVGDFRCLEPETNLTVHFLNRDLFPNGAYLGLWEKKNVRTACESKGSLILHNNWIPGRMKKLERQIFSGLWDYDSSTRMCLQSRQNTKRKKYI